MSSFIISLNNGTAHKSIDEVSDTHYTTIPDESRNCFITVTGNRNILKSFLAVKHIFRPILITPQHRVYLTRLNS